MTRELVWKTISKWAFDLAKKFEILTFLLYKILAFASKNNLKVGFWSKQFEIFWLSTYKKSF